MTAPTVITLANGEKVTICDYRTGPLSDAVCGSCGRLAYFIHVTNGERRCHPCVEALDRQRHILFRAIERVR